MRTSAVVLADSINTYGNRLTTLQVCFPRFILAEFNTHRTISKSFRSSRAVPVAKLIEEVRNHPFVPSQFLLNKPGMQGGAPLEGETATVAEQAWRGAAAEAADNAELLARVGVHKQYANRGIEPYLYVHGVISGTEWDNLFALRCHPDAQPEFQELAFAINAARAGSTPVLRAYTPDDSATHTWWHLPYISDDERASLPLHTLKAMSAARCAWVSFKPYDESTETDMEKIERTLAKLLSTPMHASPFEHQATPGNSFRSNFFGWDQLRHCLETDGPGALWAATP